MFMEMEMPKKLRLSPCHIPSSSGGHPLQEKRVVPKVVGMLNVSSLWTDIIRTIHRRRYRGISNEMCQTKLLVQIKFFFFYNMYNFV